MNVEFVCRMITIFFALLALVITTTLVITLVRATPDANKPDRHCIDGYVYYYSPRNDIYVATSNPAVACLKVEK